jgi:predicted lipoprotein
LTWRWLALLVALAPWFVLWPPVRLHRIDRVSAASLDVQDAAIAERTRVIAQSFWDGTLLPAVGRAVDANALGTVLAHSAEHTAPTLGRRPGLGGRLYYFIHGRGEVTAVDAHGVWLIPNPTAMPVLLQQGPIFGNAVRDASGLADLSAMSSFEFNAFSAALNTLAEQRVQPVLGQLVKGQRIDYVGCAVAAQVDRQWVLKTVAVHVELLP